MSPEVLAYHLPAICFERARVEQVAVAIFSDLFDPKGRV